VQDWLSEKVERYPLLLVAIGLLIALLGAVILYSAVRNWDGYVADARRGRALLAAVGSPVLILIGLYVTLLAIRQHLRERA
jgi:hypothetical protein